MRAWVWVRACRHTYVRIDVGVRAPSPGVRILPAREVNLWMYGFGKCCGMGGPGVRSLILGAVWSIVIALVDCAIYGEGWAGLGRGLVG